MALPANALVTVDMLREEGLSGAISDARAERAIGYLSSRFETLTGRRFGAATFTLEEPERYEGTGGFRLYLNRSPIIDVEAVGLGFGSGYQLSQGGILADYVRTAESDAAGYLYRASGWPASTSRHNDVTRDPKVHPQAEYIHVAYTGGYQLPGMDDVEGAPPVPADLEFVLIREAMRMLQGAGATPGLIQESTPGGWSQQWAAPKEPGSGAGSDLLPETLQVLSAYSVPSRWLA